MNLKDFTDITKLAPPEVTSGLKTDLKGIATKLSDVGATFKSPTDAAALFDNIQVPNAPTFDGAYSSLNDMMSQHSSELNKMTLGGASVSCTGPLGVPSIEDFMSAVTGGPELDAIVAGDISAESIAKLSSALSRAEGLFSAAGIDLDEPPPAPNLGSLISAATSLHKIGAESNGIGSADALGKMVSGGNVFGDAIKTAMAEGKNLKAMAAAGIRPPQFNPFDNIPGGGDIDISTESAQRLLGGG